MQLVELKTDFVSELLSLLTQFTKARHEILLQNIRRVHQKEYVPHDLAVGDFSDILNEAITEYLLHNRLLLRDSDAIHFGRSATVDLEPIVDEEARQLLQQNKTDYIEYQCRRLTENSVNEKVARKLLRIRQNCNLYSDNVPHL